MISDEESHLRKTEHDLYAMDIQPPSQRSILHDKKIDVPDHWSTLDSESKPFMKKNPHTPAFFKKIFFFSVGCLAVAVLFFALTSLFGNGGISAKNVSIEVVAKTFVDGGESLPVSITVTNHNRVPMQLTTLALEYPEGNAANPDAIASISRDLGTIDAGSSQTETVTVKLYGGEGSEKTLSAHVEFRVPGSNAVYSKDQGMLVTIRTSPIRLSLAAPDVAIPNQEIPLTFSIVGNGTEVISNTALVVEYPAGFTYVRAEPDPSYQNNVWYLGDVPPGQDRTITIYGSLSGNASEAKTIRASVGSQNASNEAKLDRIYNAIASVIPLTNAFIDARLAVGTSTSATIPISSTEPTSVEVSWTNTLPVRVDNVEIRVALSGSAYDPSKIQSNQGYFDSANNQMVWTKQQLSELASLDPGEAGRITFSLTPKSSAGANPNIVGSVSVKGYETGGTLRSATNIDRKTFVISSDLGLVTRTIHYSGPVQNSGPMPPRANQKTTYTLEWNLANRRNRVTGVRVSTILPTYVSWEGVIVPQTEQDHITYNTVTREIVWDAGEMPSGVLAPKTISFKVGITPSTSQVNSIPDLTGQILVTGHDTYTNLDLSFTKRAMNTILLNDTSNVGATGKVVP